MYTGDGSRDAKWPGQEAWVSFNELWITNAHMLARSCDLRYKQPNNNAQETNDLYDAIKQVAHETRVDHRFIFAAVMQESEGCVRAGSNGDKHGLLQDYKGAYSCNKDGKVQNPCPKDQIVGMIRDGSKYLQHYKQEKGLTMVVAGGPEGHGFAEDINEQSGKVGNDVAWAYYRASRQYNSGSIDSSDDLEKGGPGKHCYASDIANRLMGWVDAASTCTLDG